MVFNSFNFWLIFPFIFLIYWAIPVRHNRARNLFLLVVSYLLYMNWRPSFAIVLLGVTAICYLGGVILEKKDHDKRRYLLCWCFAALGLLPLLVFKYYNFLNESLTAVLESMGLHFALPGLNWAIPVGISFFTFQAVGYLLDVYKQRVPAEKDFLDFALFVSFFPQVTSGPISTAKDLIPQFRTPHDFRYEQGRDGLKMLLWGIFLKLALADRIGLYVDTVYSNYIHYSGADAFIASIMYTIQIYCDFAGYSLMAIGIAKTLGFDLINNFERPYLAASVTEFWKRWHISLTRWLTTHVYINLGGNRCSKLRQYVNIMITFLVSGLWHGANWTFIIWGALHGFFQIIEKALMGDRLKAELKRGLHKFTLIRGMRVILTFSLVSFAWIFFRMPTLDGAVNVIGKIFTDFGQFSKGPLDPISMVGVGVGLPILFTRELREEYLSSRIKVLDCKVVKWAFYILVACYTLAMGVFDSGQFIYVSF